jgi:shikimate dehydrogenase
MPRATPISGRTQLLAIFGWPLSYTRSPSFQNAALRARGVDALYSALPAPDEAAFLTLARGLMQSPQFLGANVTNPFKQAALRLAPRLSPAAKAIGAVNTLVRGPRGWEGHNTDAPGFLAALRAQRALPKGQRVLVLGAGGAARAVVWACAQAGATSVQVLARRRAQARDCAKLAGKAGLAGDLSPSLIQVLSGEAALVVNTLPGPDLGRRFGAALAKTRKGLAMDISYVPVETAFGTQVRRRGWRFSNGLPMLLEQGALSFELWTKKSAPRSQMQRALRKV